MAKPEYRWPKGLRQSIFERDGYTCQIQLPGCTTHAQCVDHILPPRMGGMRFDPTNLRAACNWCNQTRRRGTPRPTPPPAPEYW